jgi:MFS superfamily sulfate permease-like transporter
MKTIQKEEIPETGIKGLRQHWTADITAGFMVFLLALPLSLGIAKASGFPASMGVLTAIIGGLFTTMFKVSELSIKGPAAGLITICSAAILEFGGGEEGWKITTAAIMVAAIFQIIFAILKFGSLSDFFPHSAVHGMLAAIGIIIIAKQIPVLLGDEPSMYKGEGPIELIMNIPSFISHAHWHIGIIGIIGLVLMFGLPRLNFKPLQKVPAPMIVLIFTVPLSMFWHLKETEGAYSLVVIGDFWNTIGVHFSLSQIGNIVFWKYVFMFLFVNSLESLLTVKAVDNLDPYKRESSYNGDLMGIGAGNFLSGLLGGLPMISEVVRSSANIGFGGRTKWANFFHGFFLLASMILVIPLIELIPNAALAAMLIYAGYRLAAPRQFLDSYHLGIEQLAVFVTTIIVTLVKDLLVGVAAGIMVKFIFHLYNGASIKSLFHADVTVVTKDEITLLTVNDSAIFSNLIGFKKIIVNLPEKSKIQIDLRNAPLVDHSFLAFIYHFQKEYNSGDGSFKIIGLENHKALADHSLATRKRIQN